MEGKHLRYTYLSLQNKVESNKEKDTLNHTHGGNQRHAVALY